MDTETLIKIINLDLRSRSRFRGVWPCDLLPKQLEKGGLYIINLSDSRSKGTHWVTLKGGGRGQGGKKEAEDILKESSLYICSLGGKPEHENVIESLYSVSNTIIWSNFRNQQCFSSVCGIYCILTIALLSRDYSLTEIMTEIYTNSQYKNDLAVTEIVSYCFGLERLIPIVDYDFLLDLGLNGGGSQRLSEKNRLMDGKKSFRAIESTQINEGLSSMDDKKNSQAGKRKQKKPIKNCQNHEVPKRRKKNQEKNAKMKETDGQRATKGQGKKREWVIDQESQERQKNGQIIGHDHAQDSVGIVSRKVDLMNKLAKYRQYDDAFKKMLINFEKRLDFIHDKNSLRIINFLLYLIVKEKKARWMDRCRHGKCFNESDASCLFP